MNFGQIIDRSLKLVRNHTVLWKLGLLALFTEGITGGFMSMPPMPGEPATPAEEAEMTRIFESVIAWVQAHQLATVGIVLATIVVIVSLWYASLRAKAGLIATVVNLETGKASGRFLDAYRVGAPYAWRLIGLYLSFGVILSIVLGLPSVVVAGVASTLNESAQWGLFIALIPVLFALALYVHFITKMAERSIVVDGEGVWSSLGSSHRILFARPGQAFLTVLVDLGIQILFVLMIVAIIIIGVGLAALLALLLSTILPDSILAAVVGAAAVLFLAGFFLLGGWFAAFTTSYWTLVYRAIHFINNQKGK
jgi:hypothetical protein